MRQPLRGIGAALLVTLMLSGCSHYNPLNWNMKADGHGSAALDTKSIAKIIEEANKGRIALHQQETFDQSLLRVSVVQAEVGKDLQAYSDGEQRDSLILLTGGLTAAAALLFGGHSDLIAGTGLATFGLSSANSILSNDAKFAAAKSAQAKLICVLGAWPGRGSANAGQAGALGTEWDALIRAGGNLTVAGNAYPTLRAAHPSIDAILTSLQTPAKQADLQALIAQLLDETETKALISRANASMNTRQGNTLGAARSIINDLIKAYKAAQPDFSNVLTDAYTAANNMRDVAKTLKDATTKANALGTTKINTLAGGAAAASPINANDIADVVAYVAVVREYAANIADYKSRLTHCRTLGIVAPVEG